MNKNDTKKISIKFTETPRQAKGDGRIPTVSTQRMMDYSRSAFDVFNHDYDFDGVDWDYIESGLRPF